MSTELLVVIVLALPSFLLALWLTFAGFKRKAAERRGCEELLAHIKAVEDEQKNALERFLSDSLSLEAAAASAKAAEILKLRKQFYRHLLTGFLQRDTNAVANLDKHLSALTNAYHLLEAKTPPAPVAVTSAGADASMVGKLQDENQRLRQEMHITMSTLNNIFSEYTSMFGNEVPSNDLSVDQILERMQTLSSGNADDEAGQADMRALAEAANGAPSSDDGLVDDALSLLGEVAAPAGDADPSWDEAFAEAARDTDEGKI